MRPELINLESGIPGIGRVVLPSYFFLLAVAFGVGLYLARRESRRVSLDVEKMTDMWVYLVIFAMIGSRLAHVLFDGMLGDYIQLCFNPEALPAVGLENKTCMSDAQCRLGNAAYVCSLETGRCHPPRDCLAAFRGWQGGLTYYGGFLMAVLFAYVYVKRHRLRWGRVLDVYGIIVPLGLTFGRIGCYLNGCCFGKQTDAPWGAVFPSGSPASWQQHKAGILASRTLPSLPVHPTQLYHASVNLLIFFFVYLWVRPRKKFEGQVMIAFLGLYSLGRFSIEFLRADMRGSQFHMSTSQIISLLVVAFSAYFYKALARSRSGVSQAD